MDQRAGRACLLEKSGNVISECGVIDLVDQDPEESDGLVTRARLEFGVDCDNECRGNSGKQTSLIL